MNAVWNASDFSSRIGVQVLWLVLLLAGGTVTAQINPNKSKTRASSAVPAVADPRISGTWVLVASWKIGEKERRENSLTLTFEDSKNVKRVHVSPVLGRIESTLRYRLHGSTLIILNKDGTTSEAGELGLGQLTLYGTVKALPERGMKGYNYGMRFLRQ